MVSDIGGAVIRTVADGNAAPRAGGEVDAVEADAGAHDDPAFLETGDDRLGQRHDLPHHDSIAAAPDILGDLRGRRGAIEHHFNARRTDAPFDAWLAGKDGIGNEEAHGQSACTRSRRETAWPRAG